jgi:hypothetical protein
MKIKEFIEKVKGVKNTNYKPNAVSEFIRSTLEIKEYVPFVEKRDLCEKVLEVVCTKNGAIVEFDSVSRYILFTISMLTKYTNLEFENTDGLDAIDQYDMLCQHGLLNPILEVIAGEYETCNNILNMMMADIDANNNNIAAVANSALQNMFDIIEGFADVLKDKVDSMGLDLNQFNIDGIMEVIKKLPIK